MVPCEESAPAENIDTTPESSVEESAFVEASNEDADEESSVKQTAVIIDGPAFFNMMRIMGIGMVNHRKLCDLLRDWRQFPNFYQEKIFSTVVGPDEKARQRRASMLSKAKIQPIIVEPNPDTSQRNSDDDVIIRWIDDLPANQVGEVILVAADQDFLAALERAHDRGIAVTVVAADVLSGEDNNRIVAEVMRRTEWIRFIDLVPYREVLMLAPWIERKSKPVIENGDMTKTKSLSKSGSRFRVVKVTYRVPEEIDSKIWHELLMKLASLFTHSHIHGSLRIKMIDKEVGE